MISMYALSKAILPLCMIFALQATPVLGQHDVEVISPENTPVQQEEGEELVFTIVEEMPVYPGGEKEMFKFLAATVKYPEEAIENGVTGVVYVTFQVQKDGAITNARVLRGIGGGCDEEASRVVGLMPNWKPGYQRGKAVVVQYNLPIRFALTGKKSRKK